MFPQWQGSALIGGMATQTLNRITFDGKGGATPAERWGVGHRIRDVEVGSGRRAVDARGRQSRRAVPRDAEVDRSAFIAVGDLRGIRESLVRDDLESRRHAEERVDDRRIEMRAAACHDELDGVLVRQAALDTAIGRGPRRRRRPAP